MHRVVTRTLALASILQCLLTFPCAQDPEQVSKPGSDLPFHVRVDAVIYRVRVMDKGGQLVHGLTAQDFQALEKGKPLSIVHFSEENSAPVSVALFIDVGAAMKEDVISRSKEAVFNLVHALDPEDEILIGTFAAETKILADLTPDRLKLLQALENLSTKPSGSRVSVKSAPSEVPHSASIQLALSGGNSETGWAVDEAIQALKRSSHYQKAILVFSAGSPGLSESTLQHLKEAEIHFFVAPVSNRLASLLSLGTTGSLQRKSVEETGGLQFPLWQTLEQIDSVRTALKSYYLIGFEPVGNQLTREKEVLITVKGGRKYQVTALPVLLNPFGERR